MFKSNSLLLAALLLVSTGSQIVAIDLVSRLSARDQEDVRANNGFTYAQAINASTSYILEETEEDHATARDTVRQIIDALFGQFGPRQTRITQAELEDAMTIQSECAICFVPMKDDDHTKQGACHPKHRFHTACIDTWVARGDRTCPTCRVPFVEAANRAVAPAQPAQAAAAAQPAQPAAARAAIQPLAPHHGNGLSAMLITAISNNDIGLANVAIESGVFINHNTIMIAAALHRDAIARRLLEAAPDIDRGRFPVDIQQRYLL